MVCAQVLLWLNTSILAVAVTPLTDPVEGRKPSDSTENSTEQRTAR
jgi:hypothetical protein